MEQPCKAAGETPYVIGQIEAGEKGVDLMLRMAVLVSGGGTNLQAIMDAIGSGNITNAEIAVVISNNRNAYALERAKQNGIAAVCITEKIMRPEQRDFNRGASSKIQDYQRGSCCAGRLSCGDSEDHGRGLSEPDHQYPSVPDSLLLRNRLLWT